ncbi:MAG: [ribosomal protein S5]-alanine N-acetyltransferase [Verrucomicrobiota bacterium]|jgi:RimJ/RimL family protein N-acetyltransferase
MNDNTASGNEPIVILSTSRLVLRTTTENDIPILQERIFGDSDVMRYAFAGEPMAKDRSESFMRRFFTFGDSLTGMATLTEKPSTEVIGIAGLIPCKALGADDFEIGFVLARHAWGRGIASEIGAAQLSFGFDQLGCQRLLGLVDPRNTPSIHALKKLGMRYLKEVSDPTRADRSVYVIEAREWRQRLSE